MKKLLFILPVFFFTLAVNAQQTEDQPYIGKTFGNYKGTGIIIPDTDRPTKPINRQTTDLSGFYTFNNNLHRHKIYQE